MEARNQKPGHGEAREGRRKGCHGEGDYCTGRQGVKSRVDWQGTRMAKDEGGRAEERQAGSKDIQGRQVGAGR